ncbi:hypothetical protein B4U79_17811 [Dinothrombium tinctorium]|uniref:CCHC-type domain-containing protein n=1 Tax=Dinothrombium tinctorium TaxID=1965070 RepID=A0A443QYJ4_9ACAR|nr:hypothetical protein B4U79_17811 [Dinothrombium tinctorium]
MAKRECRRQLAKKPSGVHKEKSVTYRSVYPSNGHHFTECNQNCHYCGALSHFKRDCPYRPRPDLANPGHKTTWSFGQEIGTGRGLGRGRAKMPHGWQNSLALLNANPHLNRNPTNRELSRIQYLRKFGIHKESDAEGANRRNRQKQNDRRTLERVLTAPSAFRGRGPASPFNLYAMDVEKQNANNIPIASEVYIIGMFKGAKMSPFYHEFVNVIKYLRHLQIESPTSIQQMNSGLDIREVRAQVLDVLANSWVVTINGLNDFLSLGNHGYDLINRRIRLIEVDTYIPGWEDGRPSLQDMICVFFDELTQEYNGQASHDCYDDCVNTMRLYRALKVGDLYPGERARAFQINPNNRNDYVNHLDERDQANQERRDRYTANQIREITEERRLRMKAGKNLRRQNHTDNRRGRR